MSFRVTPEFKAKLDRAARESGRSLSQELELRLERSIDQQRLEQATLRNGILVGLLLAFRAMGGKAADLISESGLIFEVVASGELPAAHNELVHTLEAIESAESGKPLGTAIRKLQRGTARFVAALEKAVRSEEESGKKQRNEPVSGARPARQRRRTTRSDG
jgi:hypothetical protein